MTRQPSCLRFQHESGQRGLFVAIREKNQTFNGQQVRVLCPIDGSGETVAVVNGAYVAVNGAARGWAKTKAFWVIQGQQLVLISDSGFPNDVPHRFEVLERHIDAILKAGSEMCPLGSRAGGLKSITSAVQNYESKRQKPTAPDPEVMNLLASR